ncbi:hypothetical protein STAS_15257 [Striga asiatica]|uniref:Uncharacterized protein n=1 Tax=Striga asiatica TaxID=4170 RepID=A0A5A7Q0Q3_STRAF|nr:hypothetical protein STAS_15257 [Striga asiatica]
MAGHLSLEVAKTVMEVADVAWAAVECCHHHRDHDSTPSPPATEERRDFDTETLRSDNERLRQLLEKNLNLLHQISCSPALLHNCPSDLHDRIMSAVSSEKFLDELECHRKKSACSSPFDEPSDPEKAEVLINDDNEEPSLWVLVSEDMIPNKTEEKSGIDNENYVVVSEEHVVDGVATFMARCILANPKSLSLNPIELQKGRFLSVSARVKLYGKKVPFSNLLLVIDSFWPRCWKHTHTRKQRPVTKTLGGMNKVEKMLNIWHAGKVFYLLATWGLALASLYQGRAMLKLATLGVHHSSKMALKVL